MTTARRSPLALAAYSIGLAALAVTAFALTAMSEGPRAHLTDDRVIDVPLDGAPARDVLWTPATPVEGAVNSAVDEYEPRISADGTTMVFVRRRPGSNADLFAARWTPSGWSEPEPIEAINSDADELGPELSRDGTRLYFYSDREGGLGGYDLWRSERASATDSWPAPTNLGPAINTAANEYGPGLTPNGERLYFATNRPRPDEPQATGGDGWTATLRERRTRHDYDLYAATRSDGDWSQAVRVEAASTPADDGSPAVSPAGDFLYFASDREGGTGGYDLYRVRLAPDGAIQSDAVIESLGDAINSSANELDPGLASEGFRIYFSTDRGAAAERGYELYTSVSREVRRVDRVADADSAGPSALSGWWEAIWPWLLLLAILALLAWLLALLFAHHDAWRKRVGRMSLLAQCLLLSLLVHLLIASLLAVWKVGGMVADRLNGGGHRVILASAPTEGSELAQQVRSVLSENRVPTEAFQVAATTPTATDVTPTSSREFTPDPMVAEGVPERAPTATPETSSEAARLADATPITVTPTAPAAPAPSAAEEASAPSLASAARPAAPMSAPAAAVTASRAVDAPLPHATPSDVPVAPSATSAALLPVESAAQSSPSSGLPNEASSLVAADVSAPRAPEPTTPAPESTLPSTASQTAPIAPALLGEPSSAPMTADAPTSIAPSRTLASAAEEEKTGGTPATAELLDALDRPSIAPAASLPSEVASQESDSPRLPAAPAPLEDFAQRDPSIRSELLEKMGGNDETEQAVGRALEWLRLHQAEDGHWSSRGNGAEVDADAAMTGLALLCFVGAGHTHQEEGPYRETVAKGIRWLVERQGPDGDLRSARRSGRGSAPAKPDTMYGQTIATVALCEAYAMTRDAELAPTVRKAVDFVLARAADAKRGTASAQDTAVLGWLVMTVESARRAGFAPPADIFNDARQWLDRIAVSQRGGRYAYNPGERASAAMTAEAMFVQQLLGHRPSEPRMRESAELVAGTLPAWSSDAPTHHWYYATLALFQQQGDEWTRWNEALTRELLAHQRTDGTMAGSWDPQDRWSRAGGRVYQTAVCTLSLEVYYRYRPTAATAN